MAERSVAGRSSAVTRWAGLPRALERVAACLEAGMPLPDALALSASLAAAPVGGFLADLAADVRFGGAERWRANWAGAPAGGVVEAVPAVATAVLGGAVTGSRLSAQLNAIAADLRRARHDAAADRVRRTGVWVMLPLGGCFLPAFLLVTVVPLVAALLGTRGG